MSEPLPFEFQEEFETHLSNSYDMPFAFGSGSVADTITPSVVESENSSYQDIYKALPISRSRYILDDIQCYDLQNPYTQLYGISANIELL